MSAKLKISADTTDVKKSLLDLAKSMKDLKTSKVSIFTQEDKRMLKGELKKEIGALKDKIKQNREEIHKFVDAQKAVVKGSKEELEVRKQILEAYKVQAKLAKQLGQAQKYQKDIPGGGGGGIMDKMMSGGMSLLAMMPKMLGVGALATGALAITRGVQGTQQYNAGVGNRNQLKGLGVFDENFGGAGDLSRVGLSEQDMVQRRIDATKVLGRSGTSNDIEMRKAGFERAYGLDGGTMTGIASQFRGQVGGAGATDMQMKLQASVMAAGIEDAIGPYLESAVSLLTSINENGTANTTEMMGILAQMTKDGGRTPEQMSKMFGGINSAVQGASGESSAFLQTAFARGGIGGKTIGGTKFAMSSGGIMGLNRDELAKRGYNKDLLNSMDQSGMFSGVGSRTNAIMAQFRESGGLKSGERISDIKDTDRMVGMNNLANNIFGTKGGQGFDALMMLEKVQSKQMTQKQFDAKLKEMQEGKDPSLARLDRINSTLSGQTEVLNNINTNLLEALGKQGIVAQNAMTKGDNQVITGATNLAGAVNSTGVVEGAGNAAEASGNYINSGRMGGDLYDALNSKRDKYRMDRATDDKAINQQRRKMLKQWHPDWSNKQIDQHIKDKPLQNNVPTAKEIGKEVAQALRENPIRATLKNEVRLPDGTITDRTGK